ncbi:LysE family translocator [Micromonospora auratinigra]|uniref:Threonine/homoserine/homoserine lactone efflux protein n=1 Tax=Micromonospora auratinigra TaxID=261654 RepID=A0A1A8ZCL4_9ACTN|nr:LysE family transporter [Micromonospora auratinigra]SBT41593.1 Threonine/homoserine/homoserine lactone efflux protein [Micromonospora auratinigra]
MRGVAVLGFLAAVAPITTTPGASLTLVVSRVAAGGRRQGWWVILGTVTGLYLHATLAALGLAALVLRSSQAFWLVKLVGAGYLAGLGLWLLWTSTRRPRAPARRRTPATRRLPWRGHHPFPQALLGNVLNPKAAAIYLTLAPQFLQPGRPVLVPMLVLATAHAALHTCWLAGWTAVCGAAARLLRAARVRRLLDRLTGAVLLALGVRAALP